MCVVDRAQIAIEVLTYLYDHSDAQDTLNGIVEWWLLDHRIKQQQQSIEHALAELIKDELVVATRGSDSRTRYRMNRRKSKRIAALIGRK